MNPCGVLTKGRGLNRRPLPLEPIPAQIGLAIPNEFAELDKHNSENDRLLVQPHRWRRALILRRHDIDQIYALQLKPP